MKKGALALAFVLLVTVGCGDDIGGPEDSTPACSEELLADIKEVKDKSNVASSRTDIQTARALAVELRRKYSGIRCVEQRANNKTTTLNAEAVLNGIIADLDIKLALRRPEAE